jgi:glycyl-tRNA synthetase beta chain
MKEHQRYFPVKDENGNLLPHFITVRNGNSHAIENVARGNEKVLRARLSDAAFFYKELFLLYLQGSRALHGKRYFPVSSRFHQCSAFGLLCRRTQHLNAGKLAVRLKADEQTQKLVKRAAEISKFDLVTHMIYEFPELQGVYSAH